MVRLFPLSAAALAACAPPSQETAMRSPRVDPAAPARAAPAPIPQPVSAAENPLPVRQADPLVKAADSPAEAEGRRTLSTAFVRMGPDGHLTVERRDGRVLVLRDVVMGRKEYRGVLSIGGAAGGKYRGGYGEVAAARPGGGATPVEPDLAASNPL